MKTCAVIDSICQQYGVLPDELLSRGPESMALAYTVMVRANAARE